MILCQVGNAADAIAPNALKIVHPLSPSQLSFLSSNAIASTEDYVRIQSYSK